MQFGQIVKTFPATVALFGSQNAFYRVLHHSVVADRRSGLTRHHVGSGVPVHYTLGHVRLMALRRLLATALDTPHALPLSMNEPLATATFDHDQQTAQIVTDGCIISLAIPDPIWHELVVPATQGEHAHA